MIFPDRELSRFLSANLVCVCLHGEEWEFVSLANRAEQRSDSVGFGPINKTQSGEKPITLYVIHFRPFQQSD